MNNCRLQVEYVEDLTPEGTPIGWLMTLDRLEGSNWYEFSIRISEEDAKTCQKLLNLKNLKK